MQRITLRSPAKLNLLLKVIDKRPDGYHNLQTLFERIDLHDDIRFLTNKSGQIRLFCDHPQVPTGPRNLIYQAAHLLKQDFAVKDGVDIFLKKRIPVAAGLGGGSSNGATTLLGLNRLWGLSLSLPRLVDYGKKLGSDVPFFLYDCSWAAGTQRGDRIRPLPLSACLWHVLVVPCVKIYSREVFTHLNLGLTKKTGDVNIVIRYLTAGNIPEVGKCLSNDLEKSIAALCPRLLKVKKRMQACPFLGVSFSGSGPSVFGLVESNRDAVTISRDLSRSYTRVFTVRTL